MTTQPSSSPRGRRRSVLTLGLLSLLALIVCTRPAAAHWDCTGHGHKQLCARERVGLEVGLIAAAPTGASVLRVSPRNGDTTVVSGAATVIDDGVSARFEIKGKRFTVVQVVPPSIGYLRPRHGRRAELYNFSIFIPENSLGEDTLLLDHRGKGTVQLGADVRLLSNAASGPYRGGYRVRFVRLHSGGGDDDDDDDDGGGHHDDDDDDGGGHHDDDDDGGGHHDDDDDDD